jgi:hypothetical protein
MLPIEMDIRLCIKALRALFWPEAVQGHAAVAPPSNPEPEELVLDPELAEGSKAELKDGSDPKSEPKVSKPVKAPGPEPVCHFQRLPPEVWSHIFVFPIEKHISKLNLVDFLTQMIEQVLFRLNLKDCRSCRLVCSQWYEILGRKIGVHFPLSARTVKAFYRTQFQIDHLRVNIQEVITQDFVLTTKKSKLISDVRLLALEGTKKPGQRYDVNKRETEAIRIGEGLKTLLITCSGMSILKVDLENVYGKVNMRRAMSSEQVTLDKLHNTGYTTLTITLKKN